MSNLEYFLFAINSIKRKKIKNLLTIISISVGIISITIISIISSTGTNLIENELNTLGINGISISYNNSTEFLDNDDLDTIRTIKNVENAMPILMSQGKISVNGSLPTGIFWGIDTQGEQTISIKIISGRYFNPFDVLQSQKVCILDEDTAINIYGRTNVIGKEIYLVINSKEQKFKIIGIAKADSSLLQNVVGQYIPCVVYLPYTTLQTALSNERLNQIAVIPNGNDNAVAEKIVNVLNSKNNSQNIKYENLSNQREKLSNTLSVITTVLSLIGSISLIVAGIGTMTAMISGVTERTKEIGIKKSIGASKKNIAKEFLAESILLSMFGCIIGIVTTYLLIKISDAFFDINLIIDTKIIIKMALVSLCCGLIFGVYPAIAASKLNPADALSNER